MTSKPELTDEQVVTLQLRIMSARSFYCQLPGIEAYEAAELLTLCGIAASELQERRKTDNAEPIYQCEFCHHDANGDLQWHWEDVNKDFYDQYDSERRGQRRMIYATPQPLNDAERAELQERRKADSAEPVSFDELNAAVAEVTGGNQHAWDANIYKGHQAVPFMNYNSLARIVDKYRTPPAPGAVPEVGPVAYIFKHPAGRLFWSLTDESNKGQSDVMPVYASPAPAFVPPAIEPDYEVIKGILPTANPDEYACCIAADMWNACRAAMLQAGNSPVTPDCWIPVIERMPERDVYVQLYCADSREQMVGYMEREESEGYFRFSTWRSGKGIYCKPTHWMPLPAAPKQEGK